MGRVIHSSKPAMKDTGRGRRKWYSSPVNPHEYKHENSHIQSRCKCLLRKATDLELGLVGGGAIQALLQGGDNGGWGKAATENEGKYLRVLLLWFI